MRILQSKNLAGLRGGRGWTIAALLGAMAVSGVAGAQQQAPQNRPSVPDAQVEANVLKALASSPDLANQNIQSETVYGVVTLSGSVTDDGARQKADDVVSRVAGVQKVMDQISVGNAPAQAPAQGPGQPDASRTSSYPPQQQGPQQQGSTYPQTGYPGAPEYPQGGPNSSQNGAPNGPPQQQGQNYPPPQQQGYAPGPPNGQEAYGSQRPGDPVTISPGALLRVRINEGLSSNHNQPGAMFDGVVLNDVVADGAIAIPRGATVQGTVVTAKASGAVSGRGELTLALTNVILAGRPYPLNSDTWSQATGDKTAHTVNNAVGLGILGAIIGGVAGGGGGAAIGAAAGAGTGVAASAGSPKAQVLIPPEAILTFHIAAPTPVVTVSQAEMDRLASGLAASQPQMRRRPPPPAYYGRPY